MAGPKDNNPPLTDSQKLDRILAKITTINKRLDAHDIRLSRLEKTKVSDDAEQSLEAPDAENSGSGPGGGPPPPPSIAMTADSPERAQ